MHRRDFIKHTAAALALSGTPAYAEQLADTRKRVGLIGCGWYGKSDLLRLIQVAPVEVVSLCDVDKTMLAEAAEIVSTRQASKKKPRTFGDYREMLEGEGSRPGAHRHARSLARAADDRRGARPGSTSGCRSRSASTSSRARRCWPRRGNTSASCRSACSGAARRISIDARDRVIREGKLGTIGLVEIYCYYHMRAIDESARHRRRRPNLDYEMWTGPAPMRPYNQLVHPRSWRAFMEYGNGIVGDMCVHMLDMVRWMLDLGMPTRISSAGGILVDKKSKANITDTQTATFDYPNLQGRLDAPLVRRPAGSEVSVGRDLLRRQGHAQGERHELRLHSLGQGRAADPRGRHLRVRAVPRRQDREGPRAPRRAGRCAGT